MLNPSLADDKNDDPTIRRLINFTKKFNYGGELVKSAAAPSSPFSAILTGIGIVSLAGIVVNNNIVLIDTFNYVRASHPELPINSVIVRATAQRLRPVMLTTATTVFGLLPLALSMSVDLINRNINAGGQMAVFWGPLSQAIVFGLSFAAILTLVVTPALLALPSYLRGRWHVSAVRNRTEVAAG